MSFQYGVDLSAAGALDLTREVVGREVVLQDILNRILEQPGAIIDAPSFGFGVESRLHEVDDLDTFASRIAAAVRKDDRVERVTVDLEQVNGAVVTVRLSGRLVEGDAFTLIVPVSQLDVSDLQSGDTDV